MQQEQYSHTTKYGNKFYYKDREKTTLHRLDGPAVESADGRKEWYADGKCHRLDGPAVEWKDGSKEWYVDGVRHRLDGPAIEDADVRKARRKEWYVEGERLSEEAFNKRPQPEMAIGDDA